MTLRGDRFEILSPLDEVVAWVDREDGHFVFAILDDTLEEGVDTTIRLFVPTGLAEELGQWLTG